MDLKFYIIHSIGMSYLLQYEGNEIGKQKNKNIQIAILDSMIKYSNSIECYLKRATIKQDNEDFKGALHDYLYYIDNCNKWDYNHLWEIASCHYKLGANFEAIKYYNKAIEQIENSKGIDLSVDLSRLYFGKANCKLLLEDYRGAVDDFQLSILKMNKLDKNNSLQYLEVYSALGKARILMKDYKNAIGDLKKAVEYNMGWSSFVNGEIVENVDLAFAYYLLGAAYYYQYENNSIYSYKDDACKAWSKAGDLGNKEAYTYIKDYCNN